MSHYMQIIATLEVTFMPHKGLFPQCLCVCKLQHVRDRMIHLRDILTNVWAMGLSAHTASDC